MSAEQTDSLWIKLSNIVEYVQNPFMNNNKEVILPICLPLDSGWDRQKNLTSLSSLNPIKDECIEIWTLENPIQIWPNAIAVDIESQIMYIPKQKIIYSFQLNKDKPDIKQKPIEWIRKYTSSAYKDTKTVFTDNQLHIFEFEDEDDFTHSIYNIKTGKYEEITVHNKDLWDFDGNSMIHVPSQDKILFFGEYLECDVVSYDMKNHELAEMESLKLSSAYLFDSTAVLTNDEKYVIIFYFYRQRGRRRKGGRKLYDNKIEIKDIENNISWISNVKMPFKSSANLFAFISGNLEQSNLIIDGYIKDCELKQWPIELVGIILQFYHVEDVHLIQPSNGEHWKICLDDILQHRKE